MRIDEEVDKLRQANHDLREGLKQAIKAIELQQEHIKTLEELITSQQEHIKTLEGQLAKDSIIAVCLRPQIVSCVWASWTFWEGRNSESSASVVQIPPDSDM